VGQTHFSRVNSLQDNAPPKWVTDSRETYPKEDTSSPAAVPSNGRDRDLIEAFVQHQKAKGIRSLRKIPYLLGVFFSWLEDHGLSVADLTPLGAEEFQTYLATKEDEDGIVHYASGTVADIVQAVDAFYKTLADDGLVFQNPFYGLRHIKRAERLPRTVPTEAEMANYLKRLCAFDTHPTTRERRNWYRLHVIAELLYATGMRVGELAMLRPSDFDFEAKTVSIRSGKGGVARTAYLNDYAASVVRFYITQMREFVNHCHESDNLFGVASARNLDEALNPYFKALGGFTSHSFRHAVGTHLLRRGCDLRYIQIILGHDDLKSTALYTRVSKEELRDQLDSFHPRKEV
jgi:site-specific recombinase XerD